MPQILHGDAFGNSLVVTADTAQVYGLAGNDTLTSANHSNVLLIGGSGDDLLQLSGGDGTLSGGAGSDTFEFFFNMTHPVSALIEDIDPTSDKIIVNGTTNLQLTSSANEEDLIITDGDGYLSVTLKGVQEEKNYFDGIASDELWDVFILTNAERDAQGLSLLTLNQDLMYGSSVRAAELVSEFGHTRPNGLNCFTVLNESYTSTAENIAAGQTSAVEAVNAWMNSSGHRENILGGYTKMGVGHTYNPTSTYQNYWVQMFGGTANDTLTLTQNELSTVSITAGTSPVLDNSVAPIDPNDTSTWPSDWMFNPNFYTGGWQTISNYAAGEKIYFGTNCTGASFDNNGNFYIGSDWGVLTVQNTWDKLIDVSTAAGQTFLTAYGAFVPCVFDGRALSGYEIVAGSRLGGDMIFAGNGGSDLWGGADFAPDTLVGGNGSDIFTGGRFHKRFGKRRCEFRRLEIERHYRRVLERHGLARDYFQHGQRRHDSGQRQFERGDCPVRFGLAIQQHNSNVANRVKGNA